MNPKILFKKYEKEVNNIKNIIIGEIFINHENTNKNAQIINSYENYTKNK